VEEVAYLILADRLEGVDIVSAKELQCVDLEKVP
jgi:hypothetical protein